MLPFSGPNPYPFRSSVLLLVTLLYSVSLLANRDSLPVYHLQQFTDENGLPQNSVKAIMKDEVGFLWLCTENGLVRYDGRHFFSWHQSVIPVSSRRTLNFYPGQAAPGNGQQDVFALLSGNEHLLIKDGKAIIGTDAYKQYVAGMPFSKDLDSNQLYIIHSLPNYLKATVGARRAVIPDQTGGFFILSRDSIAYYQGLQLQLQVPFHTSDFLSFFRMGQSLLWADEQGRFTRIIAGKTFKAPLTGDILRDPTYPNSRSSFGIIWNNAIDQAFLYSKNNLYRLFINVSGALETSLVLSGFDCEQNNIITAYFDDRSQALYLGSLSKGFYAFTPQRFRSLSIKGNDKENVYYAQAVWDHDKVLTGQGHILGINYHARLPLLRRLSEWDGYNLFTSHDGLLWTRKGDVIYQLDSTGNTILQQWSLPGAIPHIIEGHDGQFWVGGRHRGIYRLDPRIAGEAALSPVYRHTAFPQVGCFQQQGKDRLWIGTARGLYLLHLGSMKLDTIAGLENANIRSLYAARAGELWITTYGNGFFLHTGKKLIPFPMDKAGYLLTAHCFVEDSLGYCWIPTNKGLFQASKADLLQFAAGQSSSVYYLYHDRTGGFNTNEFNGGCQPCAITLPNGDISLPSFNGLVWFAPATFRPVLPDKGLFIDQIQVDGRSGYGSDTIRLHREFKSLKVYCSTPYAGHPYNINIQYAWVRGNAQPEWLPLGEDMIISQSSLDHGNWTLLIRKANGFGSDNYSYKKITVIKPPAFYETPWFIGLAALLLLVFMWCYGRLRLRYIHRRNKQLELVISNRTEELNRALHSLSQSQQHMRRQMRVREILFTAMSHDIGSPLKFMSMMAEELRNELQASSLPARNKEIADEIFKSGYYLYHLTRNLLQYLRISEKQNVLRHQPFNLQQLVENKIEIFQPIARAAGNDGQQDPACL